MLRTGNVAGCCEHGDEYWKFLTSQGTGDNSRRALPNDYFLNVHCFEGCVHMSVPEDSYH